MKTNNLFFIHWTRSILKMNMEKCNLSEQQHEKPFLKLNLTLHCSLWFWQNGTSNNAIISMERFQKTVSVWPDLTNW
jgi:hypothetical protein